MKTIPFKTGDGLREHHQPLNNMPPKYIVLKQDPSSGKTRVTIFDSDAQRLETLFLGQRWAARRFLKSMRADGMGYEGVPCFCEKEGRNSQLGSMIEIPRGKL